MEGRLENENLLRTSAGAPWWPAIYLNLRTLTSCHGVPVSSRLCRVADPSRQSATGHKGRPRRRRWWPFAHSNECDGIHHRWELSQIRLAICSMLPTLCLVDPSRPYGCTACCFTGSIVSSRDSLADGNGKAGSPLAHNHPNMVFTSCWRSKDPFAHAPSGFDHCIRFKATGRNANNVLYYIIMLPSHFLNG
jgi:hypothetical protein